VIQSLSLSAEPDGFRRSMSLVNSLKASGGTRRADSLVSQVTKKDVIKNRSIRQSSRVRDQTDNVSLKSSLVNSSLNSQQLQQAKGEKNAEWTKIHEVRIIVDTTSLTVNLLEKAPSANTGREARFKMPPKPARRTDSDWYKIEMIHDARSKVLASMVLKPSECFRLLNAEPEEFQKNKINIRDLQKSNKQYDGSQIEEFAKQCKFETHEEEWTKILQSATYSQGANEIKFDLG